MERRNPNTNNKIRKAMINQLKQKLRFIKSRKQNIPLHDLFASYTDDGKMHQFQTLRSLVLINKEFNKTFKKPFEKLQKQIMTIVSLCHYFDLTQKFPLNTFQQRVGIMFTLISPKVHKNYHIHLFNKQFHYRIVNYKNDQIKEETFPNTKAGFLQILDKFVPDLKKYDLETTFFWKYLRPITAFDKEILLRYNIIQHKELKQIAQQSRILFKSDPSFLQKWQTLYFF